MDKFLHNVGVVVELTSGLRMGSLFCAVLFGLASLDIIGISRPLHSIMYTVNCFCMLDQLTFIHYLVPEILCYTK